ncbi:MAG TPA: hypothetical protein VIL77_06275 [Gaiellaceae bacterium]
MFPTPLRKLGWNGQRARSKIEHFFGQVEPYVLTSPDLSRDQHEPRHMLGNPGSEFVQFAHRQASSPPRLVFHRVDLEDGALDALAASFRVMKDTLEELKLVLG